MAVKVVLVVEQFKAVLPVMLTVGGVLSKVISVVAVAVHPFVPVTVTMYEPAVVTSTVEVVAPVFHK